MKALIAVMVFMLFSSCLYFHNNKYSWSIKDNGEIQFYDLVISTAKDLYSTEIYYRESAEYKLDVCMFPEKHLYNKTYPNIIDKFYASIRNTGVPDYILRKII